MNILLREQILRSKLVLDLYGAEIRDNKIVYNVRPHVFRMDNSMYTTWACPMKGLLSHALKLRPRGKSSLAMDYGTCIHAGLEQFMLGNGLMEALEAFDKSACELEIDKWLDGYRNSQRGRVSLSMWWEWAEKNDVRFAPLTIRGETAVELGVEKVIDKVSDVTVIWEGRVDAVVEYKGKLWIVDHKTSSMLGAKFINDKLRSSQFIGYYYTLNEVVKEEYGRPLEGVLLNVVCTGTKEPKFELYEVPFSEWQLEEWLEETRMKLYNIMRFIGSLDLKDTVVPVERELCVTKYGDCPMFQVCNAAPLARENLLRDLYEEHNWSPHAETKKIIKG